MTDEPKPCPFCGGTPYTDDSADCSGGPCAGCIDCSAHILGDTMEMAVAAWNTRAVPQPPQEPTPEAVGRAAVRVKPLEWQNRGDGYHVACTGLGLIYRITEYAGMKEPFKMEVQGAYSRHSRRMVAKIEEAKKNLGEDYEVRVLACVEAPA